MTFGEKIQSYGKKLGCHRRNYPISWACPDRLSANGNVTMAIGNRKDCSYEQNFSCFT